VRNCLSFVEILLGVPGRGLIWDLRNGPGGVLLSGRSADAGQRFISAGARRSVSAPAMIEGVG
jgi:hypothetical protein